VPADISTVSLSSGPALRFEKDVCLYGNYMAPITVEWAPNATTDRRLLELHAYWLTLGRDGTVPDRKRFNPRAIAKLLPSVFLVDVLDDPRDFRFRLVGTAFTQAAGQELTGLRIGEIFPPEFQAQVFDGWNAIVENYGPNWALGMMWLKERDYLQWQGVLLPQSQNGKIDLLMGAGVFGKTL